LRREGGVVKGSGSVRNGTKNKVTGEGKGDLGEKESITKIRRVGSHKYWGGHRKKEMWGGNS